jgi:hypothetical protein
MVRILQGIHVIIYYLLINKNLIWILRIFLHIKLSSLFLLRLIPWFLIWGVFLNMVYNLHVFDDSPIEMKMILADGSSGISFPAL